MGTLIDLTGQRFGRLTVLRKDNSVKKECAYWICRCDCDAEKSVSANRLRSGEVKSCGCLNRRTPKVSLGQKFGKLTIIQKDTSRNTYRPYWICRCDCGNVKSVIEYNLLNGSAQSCGCNVSERVRAAKFVDLTGRRFGKLVVLHYLPFEKGKRTSWLCKCDCGNETTATTSQLLSDHKHSCGCLVKEATIAATSKDYTGYKYGRLTVLRRAPKKDGEPNRWICRCECGNETTISVGSIGKTKSCGCLLEEARQRVFIGHQLTHGGTHDRLYRVWYGMIERCYLNYTENYENYGGRGIVMADEWRGKDGYARFRAWAYANGYDETAPHGKCTLDRINVNGNYEPSNCRWADMKVQQNNKRNTLYFEIGGVKKCLAEWCAEYGVGRNLVYKRLKSGWDISRALAEPSHRPKKS